MTRRNRRRYNKARVMSEAAQTESGQRALETMMETDRICHKALTQLRRNPPLPILTFSIQMALGRIARIGEPS